MAYSDHLFQVSFVKPGQSAPFVANILDAIRFALERCLDELRRFYIDKHRSSGGLGELFQLCFVSITSPDIARGLNSGSYSLTSPSKYLSYHIVNSLFHFLTSNSQLRADSEFRIMIKVMSVPKSASKALRHYENVERRKKLFKNFLLGSPLSQKPNPNWCIAIPERIGKLSLKQHCLITSLVVGLAYNRMLEGNLEATDFISGFRKQSQSCVQTLKKYLIDFAQFIWERLKGTQLESKISLVGPHTLGEILPFFFEYTGYQISAYSDTLEKLCARFPEKYDPTLKQINIHVEFATFCQIADGFGWPEKQIVGHVGVISSLNSYFNKTGAICPYCDKLCVRLKGHLCRDTTTNHTSYRTCFACKRFFFSSWDSSKFV